ncbi:MAG: hypothetical protein BGO43_00575 [Gammaproteobacteria bacterium 39-13]|nr:hypothetical protein [Gammaproteobacteria bacterium]OJV96752.1 MAG: hypothetical protein BGO43_00575 [Gammaproteobacteria bacterium 39-13]
MFKVLSVIFFLHFSIIGHTEELPTQKFFPPYPDVWGYDISDFPAMREGLADVDAYRMSDGDIWFVIDYSFKYKDPMKYHVGYKDEKYILLKFFKGEQIELDAEQLRELSNELEGKKISKADSQVNFKDGSFLKVDPGTGAARCLPPNFIRHFYILSDVEKNEKKFSILAASPHVKVSRDGDMCDVRGAEFFYGKLDFLGNLIDLGDDTFIVYAGSASLILRFDQNLQTKFKSINPMAIRYQNLASHNFFVIDYSVIEQLEKKSADLKMPFYQTVHDELLLYFAEHYK